MYWSYTEVTDATCFEPLRFFYWQRFERITDFHQQTGIIISVLSKLEFAKKKRPPWNFQFLGMRIVREVDSPIQNVIVLKHYSDMNENPF